MKRNCRIVMWVLAVWMSGGVCLAQQNFVNADVKAHSTSKGLKKMFDGLVNDQAAPAWIAYSVQAVEGNHHICCGTYTNRNVPSFMQQHPCALEMPNEGMNFEVNSERTEGGSEQILVLYRIENKKVGKLRIFSADCALDAGGLAVHWLTDVKAGESIALLRTFVPDTDEKFREQRKISETAISAIALHRDSDAAKVLKQFSDAKQPEYIRRNTAFWLGNVRGEQGYDILRTIVQKDPSEKVREQAVFALSVSKVPDAVKAMIATVQKDSSYRVRGQALFWLAHKAGKQAADAITGAVAADPELKVKKKAVFALSQLPKDEGIPRLIDIARKNKDPEIRKEAMFWLGQSKDDRALAFFEDVLTRN